jgi:hypothetical protein
MSKKGAERFGRIQDAAARALEQCEAELATTEVDTHAQLNPPALESEMKTAEPCEEVAEQSLMTEQRQAPNTTSATKSDRERMEELIKEAQELWMTGKLEWKPSKQK